MHILGVRADSRVRSSGLTRRVGFEDAGTRVFLTRLPIAARLLSTPVFALEGLDGVDPLFRGTGGLGMLVRTIPRRSGRGARADRWRG